MLRYYRTRFGVPSVWLTAPRSPSIQALSIEAKYIKAFKIIVVLIVGLQGCRPQCRDTELSPVVQRHTLVFYLSATSNKVC